MADNQELGKLAPIKTDPETGRSMETTAIINQRLRRNERILKTWGSLINLSSDTYTLNFPISYIHQEGQSNDYKPTENYITIPLKSDGELRISLLAVKLKGKPDEPSSYYYHHLVIGATIRDTHGKKKQYPDIIFHKPCNTASELTTRNIQEVDKVKVYDQVSSPLDPVLNFMALFDPQHDIDWGKLGTPTDAQTLCLKALNASPPESPPV